jgi:hypothetical protein
MSMPVQENEGGRAPYTRDAFQRQRATAKQVENREGRLLAIASVSLGLGQLAALRPLESRFRHGIAVSIEGGIFLAYMALVGWLLWRLQHRVGAASPVCPQCGVRLRGMSERVATATGRCDTCGGQVIA